MQPEWEVVPGPAPAAPREAPIGWEGELQYSVRHASTLIPKGSSVLFSTKTRQLKRL